MCVCVYLSKALKLLYTSCAKCCEPGACPFQYTTDVRRPVGKEGEDRVAEGAVTVRLAAQVESVKSAG